MSRSVTSTQATDAASSTQTVDNATQLKRLLPDGFGRGDMSVLDEVVASDFIEHSQGCLKAAMD
jgi:hypothetical protein